jgi:uncharacterized protein YpbB
MKGNGMSEGERTQSTFQKAKLSATSKAKTLLIEKYQEEFESILETLMKEAGYTPKVVSKVVWEQEDLDITPGH